MNVNSELTINYPFSMNRIYFIFLAILLFPALSFAQNDSLKIAKKEKVFGINMTPLVMRLVPFQTPSMKTGPYNFQFKKYGAKGKDAFIFQFGLNVDVMNEDNSQFNIRMGWEQRKSLTEKWKLVYGTGIMAYVGGLNIPTGPQGNNNNFILTRAGFGTGTSVGIEYYPIPQISIATESILFFGMGTEVIQIVPPIGITLNAHLK